MRLLSDVPKDALLVLDVLNVLGSSDTLLLYLLEGKEFSCLLDSHESDLAEAAPSDHAKMIEVIETELLFPVLLPLFLA